MKKERVLGRIIARELNADEVDMVSGGVEYGPSSWQTKIVNGYQTDHGKDWHANVGTVE